MTTSSQQASLLSPNEQDDESSSSSSSSSSCSDNSSSSSSLSGNSEQSDLVASKGGEPSERSSSGALCTGDTGPTFYQDKEARPGGLFCAANKRRKQQNPGKRSADEQLDSTGPAQRSAQRGKLMERLLSGLIGRQLELTCARVRLRAQVSAQVSIIGGDL